MASTARRDAPEPPDFGILKRLARDQLIYLLEQVRAGGGRWRGPGKGSGPGGRRGDGARGAGFPGAAPRRPTARSCQAGRTCSSSPT